MMYGTRFLVTVVFRAYVVRNMFQPSQLFFPISATISPLSILIVIANAPLLSLARDYPVSGDSLDQSRASWNRRKQSPTLARSLQQDYLFTDQGVNDNSPGGESIPTESPSIDATLINDELDNSANDDITVVVPLDFARGENIDDGLFTEPPKGTDGDITTSSHSGFLIFLKQNRTISWTCGAALVFSIAGYLFFRRRERSRYREYRTHRILQEHVEAFDLSFRDEDDVELSNFSH